MTDPRRLLARLNPSTIRYDTLPGGVPELTAQDIAHALALTPAGLGREVLEACWWSDGAALRRGPLRDAAVALVVPEIRRQQQRLLEARTDVGIVKACMGWTRATTSAQQAALRRAQERLDKLKAHPWPQATLEMLPVLVAAVVGELSTPQLCPCCHGRGERRVGALVKVCTACGAAVRFPPVTASAPLPLAGTNPPTARHGAACMSGCWSGWVLRNDRRRRSCKRHCTEMPRDG